MLCFSQDVLSQAGMAVPTEVGAEAEVEAESGSGTYSVRFGLTRPGDYLLAVSAGGTPIGGSPFPVRCAAGPIELARSTLVELEASLKGVPLELKTLKRLAAPQPLRFLVRCRDRFGNARSGACGRALRCELRPTPATAQARDKGAQGVLLCAGCRELGDGTVEVAHTVRDAGRYGVWLGYQHDAATHQLGELLVEPPVAFAADCTPDAQGVLRLQTKKAYELTLLSCDEMGRRQTRGGEQLRVQLHTGPGPIAVEVHDQGDGQYKVNFGVHVSGEYLMAVAVEGKPAAGSPFAVLAHSSSDGRSPTRSPSMERFGSRGALPADGAERRGSVCDVLERRGCLAALGGSIASSIASMAERPATTPPGRPSTPGRTTHRGSLSSPRCGTDRSHRRASASPRGVATPSSPSPAAKPLPGAAGALGAARQNGNGAVAAKPRSGSRLVAKPVPAPAASPALPASKGAGTHGAAPPAPTEPALNGESRGLFALPSPGARCLAATPSPSIEAGAKSVVVVGSVNVDLYRRARRGAVKFGGKSVDVKPIKGMTLPASSFVALPKIKSQSGVVVLPQLPRPAEAFVMTMDGPFEQKTGGKGANAAAAAGQTFACELVANMGGVSAEQNAMIRRDLAAFGGVGTQFTSVLEGTPTGSAYILLYEDNDNAILLLGGANQAWPAQPELEMPGGLLHTAVSGAVAVMLQREVPEHVNVAAARLAHALGTPVFMDVGGTDAPLDPALLPYLTVIAPNESELTFISGVKTERGGKLQMGLVRQAVRTLKAKFAAKGNAKVEVLVTLGAQGSVHFGPQWSAGDAEAHETRMGHFALTTPDGKPKDTTGAGDCFRGSYVGARYGEGKGVPEAMRWAAAAAACSVELEGAMPSMPPRDKIAARCAQPVLGLDGPISS